MQENNQEYGRWGISKYHFIIVIDLKVLIIRILFVLAIFQHLAVCANKTFTVCDTAQRAAKYSFQKITRLPDPSIVRETLMTSTRRRCIYHCLNKRSYSMYYIKSSETCKCNDGLDSNTGSLVGAEEIFYGKLEYVFEGLLGGRMSQVYPQPPERDCLQLYQNGFRVDGVYIIQPTGGVAIETFCDMTNGGWTIFQHREDGSENFFRNWTDYVSGFGNRCGEYWLGLENIHLLTIEPSELYISLETFGDRALASGYARYSTFIVDNNSSDYKLTVGGYSGNCGDSMVYHNGKRFSTVDNDNDNHDTKNCANLYKGGWWYSTCHRANLNGLYLGGTHQTFADGINWHSGWYFNYSLKETVMKVRRV